MGAALFAALAAVAVITLRHVPAYTPEPAAADAQPERVPVSA